jgi:glycine cleavage system aminomethyltransferase T/glycine/D-amino acid oxidase-like deaminating enzyme
MSGRLFLPKREAEDMSSLPSAARVVIVGGGVIGCSTAYHLAKAGCRDIVLLERSRLTSGTTWHSAAQVRTLRASASLTRLISYGVSLYASLSEAVGQSTGWIRTGSLTVAASADRLTALKRMASLARAYSVEAHILAPNEAGALWPEMRTDDLHGAVLLPADGRVNPSDLCAALVKGFKAEGGQVLERTSVTGFRARNGRVAAVETTRGVIEAEIVVNCAGLWGREVAGLAGVAAPLFACEHFYVITKPFGVPPDRPTLGYPDGHVYMRAENGGMLVGCFEPRGKALPLESLPPHFEFDLLPDDWEHFAPMMENAIQRVPALENAQIRTFLNGPESFTFDDRFHIGEAPELAGFYLGCGMNSVGVASAGGIGRALAEMIVEGRPSMDLSTGDIRRIADFHNNARVLRDRVPETLGLHYAVPFPGREYQTVRDLRRSPVHDRLTAAGALFGQRMGWERPLWFGKAGASPDVPLTFGKPGWLPYAAAEHRAAREAAALFDQTPLTKLLVQGADAERLLDRVCTGDMTMSVGQIRYTLMLDDRGFIASDPIVMRRGQNEFLVVTGAFQATRDREWLRRQIEPGEHVTLTDVTSAYAVFGVMGPRSRELLNRLGDADLSNEGFPYGTEQRIDLGYAPVVAARLSYVGELGWELYVATEWAATLYDSLMECGADLGLRPAGLYAMSSLRIEKGNRAWGHDIGLDDMPWEAGLGFALAKGKAVFIGGEPVLNRRANALDRRLLHFVLDDADAYPLGDEPILRDGEIVGTLTSSAFGHTLGRAVAMGYVRANGRALDDEGVAASRYSILVAGEIWTATASTRPFFDPSGARMRA